MQRVRWSDICLIGVPKWEKKTAESLCEQIKVGYSQTHGGHSVHSQKSIKSQVG